MRLASFLYFSAVHYIRGAINFDAWETNRIDNENGAGKLIISMKLCPFCCAFLSLRGGEGGGGREGRRGGVGG